MRWAMSLDEQTAWSPYTARANGGNPSRNNMLDTGRRKPVARGKLDGKTEAHTGRGDCYRRLKNQ
jgi:hypothetical protein